jgi:hypothetical protein
MEIHNQYGYLNLELMQQTTAAAHIVCLLKQLPLTWVLQASSSFGQGLNMHERGGSSFFVVLIIQTNNNDVLFGKIRTRSCCN